MIKNIIVKEPLNKIDSDWLPYNWDLNIYRGCSHTCRYCYALYSHKYLESENFFGDIFVKTNIAQALDRKLSSKSWRGEIINLGGVTDSYQQIEKQNLIMRDILKVMIKHRNPICISTKSELILRDIDLFCELASYTKVNIAVTITTTDEALQKIIEPGASSPKKRFEILEQFSKTKISTGLHLMPILPFISDNKSSLEDIFSNARKANCNYVITAVLNLRGDTKTNYLKFIEQKFPDLISKYTSLYKSSFVTKEYNKSLYKEINLLKRKYHYFNEHELEQIKEKLIEQLDLDL
ncbi:MAG: radical SAM protein [bacterium]